MYSVVHAGDSRVNEGVDKQYRTRIEYFDPNPLQTGEILVQCPS